jgi:hypothetical protein
MVATIVLALVVALISASAGLAQATLGVSGVGVAARQRAVDAELALLREVVDRLAALSAGLTGAIRKNRVIDDEAAARLDTARCNAPMGSCIWQAPDTAATRPLTTR